MYDQKHLLGFALTNLSFVIKVLTMVALYDGRKACYLFFVPTPASIMFFISIFQNLCIAVPKDGAMQMTIVIFESASHQWCHHPFCSAWMALDPPLHLAVCVTVSVVILSQYLEFLKCAAWVRTWLTWELLSSGRKQLKVCLFWVCLLWQNNHKGWRKSCLWCRSLIEGVGSCGVRARHFQMSILLPCAQRWVSWQHNSGMGMDRLQP